jgi:hypothetical protein
MAIAILHTGQTGVERGACRAARATHFPVSGICNHSCRDEFGALAPEYAAELICCAERGVRSALRATLETANAVVIGVADVERANDVTGIRTLRQHARSLGLPCWLVDPQSDLSTIAARLRELERTQPHVVRVMVTGPRLTRWQGGESLGFRVVSELSFAPSCSSPHDDNMHVKRH